MISQHQKLLYNVRDGQNYGQLVKGIRTNKLRKLEWFRQNLDKTRIINTLNQSKESDTLCDWFLAWLENGYSVVFFSKEKIKTVTESAIQLQP